MVPRDLHVLKVLKRLSGFFYFEAAPRKERLTAQHTICLHIFRHSAHKSLDRRQPACGISVRPDTKTEHGGTDNVWFYDMTADGFSLDDKRSTKSLDDKIDEAKN